MSARLRAGQQGDHEIMHLLNEGNIGEGAQLEVVGKVDTVQLHPNLL